MIFFENIDGLLETLTQTALDRDEYWLIYIASGSESESEVIRESLNLRKVSFHAVVLPALISRNKVYYHGFMALKLVLKVPPLLFTDLNARKVNSLLKKRLPVSLLQLPASALLFVDGYFFSIEKLINETFSRYTPILQFSGCGTGIQSSHVPSIMDNNGSYKNAALLLIPDMNLSVALMHGYKRLAEPVLVTKCRQNILQELNYQNAFRVYRNLLKDNFSILINRGRYYDIAREYPLGIYNSTVEDRVREIVAVTEKGEIILSGDVFENQYMGLLHAEPFDFFRAADRAVIDAASGIPEIKMIFFFDCIMRNNKIKGTFKKEADRAYSIATDLAPAERFMGALTIGQIVNGEGGSLYFYKNTVSALAFF